MGANPSPIQHVSDTALWVATYRAREDQRPDALFHDPLARLLTTGSGEKLARQMALSKEVEWAVIVRTCVIDEFLKQAFSEGVDTVLNLGAGLDTRPYRMDFPQGLSWVEVDYPLMVTFKEERLKGETTKCNLERIGMDLADDRSRKKLLASVAEKSKKTLVLTEGVLPYLSNDHVANLALDLRAQSSFVYWVVDYFAPQFFKYMKRGKIKAQMQKAPFIFEPADWHKFFESSGWKVASMRYNMEEGVRLNRPAPTPWWGKLLSNFASAKQMKQINQMSGYALLKTL